MHVRLYVCLYAYKSICSPCALLLLLLLLLLLPLTSQAISRILTSWSAGTAPITLSAAAISASSMTTVTRRSWTGFCPKSSPDMVGALAFLLDCVFGPHCVILFPHTYTYILSPSLSCDVNNFEASRGGEFPSLLRGDIRLQVPVYAVSLSLSLSLSLSPHTHAHTHTVTLSFSLSLSLSCTHSLPRSLTFSLTFAICCA